MQHKKLGWLSLSPYFVNADCHGPLHFLQAQALCLRALSGYEKSNSMKVLFLEHPCTPVYSFFVYGHLLILMRSIHVYLYTLFTDFLVQTEFY